MANKYQPVMNAVPTRIALAVRYYMGVGMHSEHEEEYYRARMADAHKQK